jgi:hypothetical protein
MQPDHQEPKHGTIESVFASCSSEKKKGDISTSAIDESLQITESDETTCCSTDEPLESLSPFSSSATAAAATETLLFPHTLAVPQKNHHPHLEKISSVSSTFEERLIRKISNFQSRSISMSETKIVTDSKFPGASLQEIL